MVKKMTSKRKYKMDPILPAYNVGQWLDYYKSSYQGYLLAPADERSRWADQLVLLLKIKGLLREHGAKFI